MNGLALLAAKAQSIVASGNFLYDGVAALKAEFHAASVAASVSECSRSAGSVENGFATKAHGG